MRKNSEIIKELERYWYDQQYLKEKLKEVEQFDKISSKSNNAEFLSETKQIEESEIKMFFQKKKSLERKIQNLNQPYRTLMYLKYISFFNFDQIASRMNYSKKRIYQLHSEAIELICQINDNKDSKD